MAGYNKGHRVGFESCRVKKSEDKTMKVRPSVKRMCSECRIIRRHGIVRVICKNPRHKQRQG